VTKAQRRALEAICATFCPDDPPARRFGVADTLLELTPSSDRRALLGLLSLWDVGRRFSRRPRERREAILRAWRDSGLAFRRRVYHGLRRGSLVPYYAALGVDGYELPELPPAAPKRIATQEVTSDTQIDCDVCVIGSGAGGGVAAAVLAGAGLDVVVLEAGPHLEDEDFGGPELDAYQQLYLDAAASTTVDGGVGLLAGRCVGGTTTVNYSTSFRTPDEIRAEWGEPFLGRAYERSLDAVWERLGVNSDHNRPSHREQVMERGLRRLGWHVDAMPRNVRGCEQGVICGRCGFGCPLGAKQSAHVTWLVDAQTHGTRVFAKTRAHRIRVANGTAAGVEARTDAGHAVSIRARAIVVSAGALHTPALLRRSGLTNANIGKHLHLHPTMGVIAIFDEEIRPWEGTMQALYSDEHRDLADGYGLKYETAAVHPGVLVSYGPWDGAQTHRELANELRSMSGIGILLRDRSSGEVRVGRDGGPRVRYRFGEFDLRHVRVGLDGAAQIFEAAGARRIFSSHARLVSYEPGNGNRAQFLRDADAVGYGPGQCTFYSFHIMGTARLGTSPESSACKPTGETWETRGLYVMDGSSFPSASGVNPMLTIEAIAHMNASQLAAELT
jgi:choline dehydrogenase-like flavoprotein